MNLGRQGATCYDQAECVVMLVIGSAEGAEPLSSSGGGIFNRRPLRPELPAVLDTEPPPQLEPGFANRTSVSVYQRRYPAMPRPMVDLGRGRAKLWSRQAVTSWAVSAD